MNSSSSSISCGTVELMLTGYKIQASTHTRDQEPRTQLNRGNQATHTSVKSNWEINSFYFFFHFDSCFFLLISQPGLTTHLTKAD